MTAKEKTLTPLQLESQLALMTPAGNSQDVYLHSAMPSLRLVQSSRNARRLALLLVVVMAIALPALLLVPWQQTVNGKGTVAAYAPLQRQQTVQSPVSGRIVKWNERVAEGVLVNKGEMILEIEDLDPDLLTRLKEQEQAQRRKLEVGEVKQKVYREQAAALEEAKRMAVTAAEELVKAAKSKVAAEEQKLTEMRAAESQETLDYARQQKLAKEGIASGLERQVAERKFREATAKVKQAEAYLAAAKSELASKQAELIQKEREAQAKIDTAIAYLQDALGELAMAEKDLADIRVKVARQESQVVLAPQNGYIFRLLANPGANYIKAGDPLFVLIPDAADMAVELWLDGNDLPLVSVGRHVRLQFEGWPAVQFAAWPSVAVGTFGGEVASIDAWDNGTSQFRVLVVPSEGEAWPDEKYLRQGVRANGWVLLGQVTLGYELWRQLNGFPPALKKKSDGDDAAKSAKLKKA